MSHVDDARQVTDARITVFGIDIDPGSPTFLNDANIKSIVIDSVCRASARLK